MSAESDGESINLGGQLSENTISFSIPTNSEPILVLRENGDIFVKGRLAENDKEIVDALREFLKSTGYLR